MTELAFSMAFALWFVLPAAVLAQRAWYRWRGLKAGFLGLPLLTSFVASLAASASVLYVPALSCTGINEHPFSGSGNFRFMIMPYFSILSLVGTLLMGAALALFFRIRGR
jgi:hypothetical protein